MNTGASAALAKQTAVCLTKALAWLVYAGRHLHPGKAAEVAESMAAPAKEVKKALDVLVMTRWSSEWRPVGDCLLEVCARIETSLSDFRGATRLPGQTFKQMQALRGLPLAEEMLYPLCDQLPEVSAWFTEPGAVVPQSRPAESGVPGFRVLGPATGLMHFDNDRDTRAGVSLYVPEYYQDDQDWPLMIVLHGASDHGRNYIWSWLRAARSRGVLLMAPTSTEMTWSILGQNLDGSFVLDAIRQVRERYQIDDSRILLAGLSDGATYSWLPGLVKDSPCTHLAVLSGALHPLAFHEDYAPRLKGKPVYWLQGALDAIFPVGAARECKKALIDRAVDLTYREVADLPHTQARDENQMIMDWFGCPQYS